MSEEDNGQISPIDPLTIGELITLPEAAEKFGFTARFLARLALSGKLKAKKSSGTWLTTKVAVEEYKNNRSFKNIPKKYRDRP
jgi:hypothetical protein